MKVKKFLTIMVGCFCAIFFCASPVKATLITIKIEGVVDYVGDPYDYLEGKISPGDAIMGTYTYDTGIPDSTPAYAAVGRYEHFAPPAGICVTVGGFEFRTDTLNVDFLVAIANNVTSGGLHDSYWIYSYNNVPLSSGTWVDHIYWSLTDYSATAAVSIDLPATAPVLHDWQENILGIGADRLYGISAHVTSAIPEPTSVLLFALGGLLLGKRS
jgi:hypothetical protein